MKFKFYQKAKILFGVLITLMSLGLFSSATFAAAPPTPRDKLDEVCNKRNGIINFETIADELRRIHSSFNGIATLHIAQIQALCLVYVNNCEWGALCELLSGHICQINADRVFSVSIYPEAWTFLRQTPLPELGLPLDNGSSLLHYIMHRVTINNDFNPKTYDGFTKLVLMRTQSGDKLGLTTSTPPDSPRTTKLRRSDRLYKPVPKACWGVATESTKWGPFFEFITALKTKIIQGHDPRENLAVIMGLDMPNTGGQTPLDILNVCQNREFVEKVKGILGLQ